jgi:hypothetical protein
MFLIFLKLVSFSSLILTKTAWSPSCSSCVSVVPLTGNWRYISEKGRSRRSMFFTPKNVEELRRLYESDTPVLAYAFKRRAVEGWTPGGQLL